MHGPLAFAPAAAPHPSIPKGTRLYPCTGSAPRGTGPLVFTSRGRNLVCR